MEEEKNPTSIENSQSSNRSNKLLFQNVSQLVATPLKYNGTKQYSQSGAPLNQGIGPYQSKKESQRTESGKFNSRLRPKDKNYSQSSQLRSKSKEFGTIPLTKGGDSFHSKDSSPSPSKGSQTVAPAPKPLHKVCNESLASVENNATVKASWRKHHKGTEGMEMTEIKNMYKGKQLVYSDINHGLMHPNLKNANLTEENEKGETTDTANIQTIKDESTSVEDKKKRKNAMNKNAGKSGSNWEEKNVKSLNGLQLVDLDMDAMLPGVYKRANDAVEERLGNEHDEKERLDLNVAGQNRLDKSPTLSVKQVLEVIEKAKETDLSKYTEAPHMFNFLCNPWCCVFLALRDLLARGESEMRYVEQDLSRSADQSTLVAEFKDENMSEQLVHRFMEVILILFSKLYPTFGNQDELRSTADRDKGKSRICKRICEILDDGSVYMSRGGTSNDHDRARFGNVPVIRYETKSGSAKGGHSQVFAELLGGALKNLDYLRKSHPSATKEFLVTQTLQKKFENRIALDDEIVQTVPYQDVFVVSVKHYTLTLHTARFPTDYLLWVEQLDMTDTVKEAEETAVRAKKKLKIAEEANQRAIKAAETEKNQDNNDQLKSREYFEKAKKEHDDAKAGIADAIAAAAIVAQRNKELNEINISGRFCILHKMSETYNLIKPSARREAALNILIILWAIVEDDIVHSGVRKKIYVPRVRMTQTVTNSKLPVAIPEKNPLKKDRGPEGKSELLPDAAVNKAVKNAQKDQ